MPGGTSTTACLPGELVVQSGFDPPYSSPSALHRRESAVSYRRSRKRTPQSRSSAGKQLEVRASASLRSTPLIWTRRPFEPTTVALGGPPTAFGPGPHGLRSAERGTQPKARTIACAGRKLLHSNLRARNPKADHRKASDLQQLLLAQSGEYGGASNRKRVRRRLPTPTSGQRKKAHFLGPFHSGGGIRTRDLRVMSGARDGSAR